MEGKETLSRDRTNIMDDSYKIIDVEDEGKTHRLKLNIWDAAGDNRTADLAHMFVRDVQAAVLVYSITSNQSF